VSDDEMMMCSPLAAVAPIEGGRFQQCEKAHTGKIILRGAGDDADFLAAAEKVLAAPLPQTPNTTVIIAKDDDGAANEDEKLLWLGPNEWMLWTRLQALREAFGGLFAAAVDVSDYYTVIRLSGELATDVLRHGCPLDLRETAFKTGTCAQSRFRNAPILLYKVADAPIYDVQVRWSFAHYLWHYFATLQFSLDS